MPRKKSTMLTHLAGVVLFCLAGSSAIAAAMDGPAKKLDHQPNQRAIEGERYGAMVPDTLDLADRMALAVNALTQAWFPEEKWALGFRVYFSYKPPVLAINHATDAYLNIPPKFIEALALCRLGSGSSQNIAVDRNLLNAQLQFLGDDGLTYCPTDTLSKLYTGGRPLQKGDEAYSPTGALSKIFTDTHPPQSYSEIWGEGRMLIALSMLAQIDDDPRWREIGKRKIDRLMELSSRIDGFRCFSTGRFFPGQKIPREAGEPTPESYRYMYSRGNFDFNLALAYSMAPVAHGSALYYRVTGYRPALELSAGLSRWAFRRLFCNPDGRWEMRHFHGSTYALIGMCEYGIAAQDREILERVDACYRWAREMGDPLIGYFTENMPGSKEYLEDLAERGGSTVEICEVADMIWLALQLTRAGLGDYWDDVDRWTRNMFAEGQLVHASQLDHLPDSYFNPQAPKWPYVDQKDIWQRSRGSFLSWMRANDGFCIISDAGGAKRLERSIMHCCTGNGSRTLYCIWDSIITETDGEVAVNLLLNRCSPWLDVDSYLPAEGKVVLHIKKAVKVSLRFPEWCDPRSAIVRINGQITKTVSHGQYLLIAMLKPHDEVTLDFGLPQKEVFRVLGEKPYKLTLRGSNVVKIDPPGVAYPLFQNQPDGKLRKKIRYISTIPDIIW
jgi:hypothetical protein